MSAKIAKGAWLLLCSLILKMTLMAVSPAGSESDIGLFFFGCMLVLTFPSGLGIVALVALLVELQSRTGLSTVALVGSNPVGFVLMWLALVAAGYWQWFWLVPRLRRFVITRNN